MMQTYSDTVIGGVLITPFVAYLACALVAFLLLRPVMHRLGFDRLFSHPPIAECSLFIIILACFVTLF